jgi:hypothetical protein
MKSNLSSQPVRYDTVTLWRDAKEEGKEGEKVNSILYFGPHMDWRMHICSCNSR